GVTTYKPGYFNVPGTVVAILLLAVGFNGLNLLGAPFWMQPIFNGAVLIVAVITARSEARQINKGSHHVRPSSSRPPKEHLRYLKGRGPQPAFGSRNADLPHASEIFPDALVLHGRPCRDEPDRHGGAYGHSSGRSVPLRSQRRSRPEEH